MQVFKYPFEVQDHFSLEMPNGARIIHVAVQHGFPCMWALVDPSADKVRRQFRFAGTGHAIDEPNITHIGSMLVMGGDLVFHLFEITE